MSRYDLEEYLPWYRRPTPTWLELSGAARGVLVSIAMELNPKTGEMTLRKGLASLATLLRLPWTEVEPALAELIAQGKLEWDGSRFILRDPEYRDRERPGRRTSTERMRDKRSRDACDEKPSRDGSDARDACDDRRGEERRSEEITAPLPLVAAPKVTAPKSRRKPETPCPESDASDLVVATWASQWKIPIRDVEFPKFLDHHRKADARWRDWSAAWRTWLRNAPAFARAGPRAPIVQSAENRAWVVPEEMP